MKSHDQELDRILRSLTGQHWRVSVTQHKTLLLPPDGSRAIPVPVSVKDARGLANWRAQLTRAGWRDPQRQQARPNRRRARPGAAVARVETLESVMASALTHHPVTFQEPRPTNGHAVAPPPPVDAGPVTVVEKQNATMPTGISAGKPTDKVMELLMSDGSTRFGCGEDGCEYAAPTFASVFGHRSQHSTKRKLRTVEDAQLPPVESAPVEQVEPGDVAVIENVIAEAASEPVTLPPVQTEPSVPPVEAGPPAGRLEVAITLLRQLADGASADSQQIEVLIRERDRLAARVAELEGVEEQLAALKSRVAQLLDG